jgi:hypothetical protein
LARHTKIELTVCDLEDAEGCFVAIRELADHIRKSLERFALQDHDKRNLEDIREIINTADEGVQRLVQFHPKRRTDGSDSDS